MAGAVKLAPALPSSTSTLPENGSATARSGSPSPLNSPTAIEKGPVALPDGGRRGEAATGGAEQHQDLAGHLVSDSEVGVTVAIEVAHRDRGGKNLPAGKLVGPVKVRRCCRAAPR